MDPFQGPRSKFLVAASLVLLALVILPEIPLPIRAVLATALVLVVAAQFIRPDALRRDPGVKPSVDASVLAERRRYIAEAALSSRMDSPRRLLLTHLILYP